MNGLQGVQVSTPSTVNVFSDCSLQNFRDGTYHDPFEFDIPMRVVGVDTIAGRTAIQWSHAPSRLTTDYQTAHAWFASDVPFPLRVAVEHDDEPGVFEVIQMTRFDAGAATDGLEASVVELHPAPALEHAPRERWGPSDAGINHRFPLSEAFDRAREDAENRRLAGFLARHSDAYVADAYYTTYRSWDNVTDRWEVTVTNGTERLDLRIARTVAGVHREVFSDGLPVRIGPAQRTTYHVEEIERARPTDDQLVHPSLVPQWLPTVDSLWARWSAFAPEELDSFHANDYGFTISCLFTIRPCEEQNLVTLEVGYRGGASEPGSPDGPVGTWETYDGNQSHVEFRIDGTVERSRYYSWEAPPSLLLPASPADSASPLSAAAAPTPELWTVPDGSVVFLTLGAAALLGGLIYWWPRLRTGVAAGLFSRIQRHDALDHPVRREIMQVVEAEPGIHQQAIVRRLGRRESTVAYHLRKLEEVELLRSNKGHGYRCFFAAEQADRHRMAAAGVVKSEGARAIHRVVRDSPGISPPEIARATGLTAQTVHYHLQRMERAGLLRVDHHGRRSRVLPSHVP